jgi:hypothetical protein
VTAADLDALIEVQRRSYETARGGLRGSWPETQALGREELRRFLDELVYGVLATARLDGRAHAAPVAFSLDGGAFWVGSVEGLRLRNLRATPWASLVLFDGQRGERHRALTAEGPVRLHEGANLRAVRHRLDTAWVARHGSAPVWAAAFLELRPERVFSHRSQDA